MKKYNLETNTDLWSLILFLLPSNTTEKLYNYIEDNTWQSLIDTDGGEFCDTYHLHKCIHDGIRK